MDTTKIKKIRRLVGPVTEEQLRYVDSFASDEIGLFMPVGGACFYAQTPAHHHPAYMFVLSFDDSTRLRLNGEIFVARPGQLFGLAPSIPHEELNSDIPPRYIAVLVDPDFFRKQLSAYLVSDDILQNGSFFDSPAELLPALKRFMIEADASMPGKTSILYGLSLEICHLLIRAVFGSAPTGERFAIRLEIDRVVQFLHSKESKKITIKEMAELACMSPSHFVRTFKEELGISPAAYLLEVRLKLAKKMLVAGDMGITEIALDCGFSSVSHFSSRFKKQYKISPSKLRNQLNKAE